MTEQIPEDVAKVLKKLRDYGGHPYTRREDAAIFLAGADVIEAQAAENADLRARLAEATAERDELKARFYRTREERDKAQIAAANYANFNHKWRRRAEAAEAKLAIRALTPPVATRETPQADPVREAILRLQRDIWSCGTEWVRLNDVLRALAGEQHD